MNKRSEIYIVFYLPKRKKAVLSSPDGDEYYIVSFPFIENEYYYNILFGFGDKCECLEPLFIRTEVKRRIHDIAAIYKS